MTLGRWHPNRTALSCNAVAMNTGVAEAWGVGGGQWHWHTSRWTLLPRAPSSTQPPSVLGRA